MPLPNRSLSLATRLVFVVVGGFLAILTAMIIVGVVASRSASIRQTVNYAEQMHALFRATHVARSAGATTGSVHAASVSQALARQGNPVRYLVRARTPSDSMPVSGDGAPVSFTGFERVDGVEHFRYVAPFGPELPDAVIEISFPASLLRGQSRNAAVSGVGWVGSVLVVVGVLVFWIIRRSTRRIATLTQAVRDVISHHDLTRTIEVQGTDEVGQLATAFNNLLGQLREMIAALSDASATLAQSGVHLDDSSNQQQEIVARQAAAIQESLVTAEEIKQTSITAADRAEGVLRITDAALAKGEEGELSIQESLMGLSDIRSHVLSIAERISMLSTRTQQISGITQTVKDLADSSNMLALNAAIEAVRSGEHGKGFGVVAREIRNLADQSIQSTRQVREILEDIGSGIQAAVAITEEGSRRIEAGLIQVKQSGDTLARLAQTVKENSSAARQIAAAVSQQNAGIVQIFTALTDQSKLTEATLKQLQQTTGIAGEMKHITERVSTLVKQYRV